jgi:hypothetical protein
MASCVTSAIFPFPFEDGLTVAAGDEIFIGIRKVMIIIYQLTYIFLSWNCVLLSTNKGGQINFGVRCHEPNRAFLVPDLCRATEKNGNSISTDVTGSTQEHHERLCSTHDISERTSVV